MTQAQADPGRLLERAAAGEASAWGELLTAHEPRLRRVVMFRLDARLNGRVDVGDVMQETYLEATRHRARYFSLPPPRPVLFLWLRGIVGNKLLEVHRHHLGTRARDANRELRVGAFIAEPDDAAAALCANLTAGITRPSVAVARAEACERISAALAEMDAIDREVLALRHFEQLTSSETADVLGIQERAAAKRYLRALKRLKDILAGMPGGLTELRP
jgi:RNA polymerase sigma-70 factor (ECF subfamily)